VALGGCNAPAGPISGGLAVVAAFPEEGALDVPIPFSPPLEDVTVPTEKAVFEMARTLCGRA